MASPTSLSERSKSDLYREMLPLLTSGRVELLDHARLATELLGLERRTGRGGRDSIDHGPGGHDDLANAAAGALVSTSTAPTVSMLLFDEEQPKRYDPLDQVKEGVPHLFYRPDPALTCGTCTAFEAGRCRLRLFAVEPNMLKCDFYDPLPEGEER